MSNHGDPLYQKNIVLKNGGSVKTQAGTAIISVSSAGVVTVSSTTTTLVDLTTTGNTTLGNAVTDTTAINGATTITTTSASGLTVGRQGATSPQLKVDASASSVATGLEVVGAASGSGVTARAIGGTNETLTLSGKGTGPVVLGQATSTDVRLSADQPIADSSGNEYLKFSKTASAVNEVTFTNAATNTGPIVAASGGDSNIPLLLQAKGTQSIILNAPLVESTGSVLSVNTTGGTTLTAAQVLAGIAVIDCNGAGRTLTFPTATALIAAVPGCVVGQTFMLLVVNGSDAAETITLAADASGGFDSNQTATSRVIPQNTSKIVYVRITNVGSPAYVMYA